MVYQGIFEKEGVFEKVVDVLGFDFIGIVVNVFLFFYKEVCVLFMEFVFVIKGIGVVIFVLFDFLDDYVMVIEFVKKVDFYGIKKEWVELEIIFIIQIFIFDFLVFYFVKKFKIVFFKDVKQFLEVKEFVYKEGFYQGVMKVGEFVGEKVEVVKFKVREQLIKVGEVFVYFEFENKVVFRFGDECIVVFMDQWYIDYGEDLWCIIVYDYVENKDGKGFEIYFFDIQYVFKGVFNWLKQWVCVRIYGLGFKFFWDFIFFVESLSDFMIYMVYYIFVLWFYIDLFGCEQGKGKIVFEQMIDEVWDYVFVRIQLIDEFVIKFGIFKEIFQGMCRDFEYFYFFDFCVSGKDLIFNYFIFWFYNYIVFFFCEFWFKLVCVNGYFQFNGVKMVKFIGNFMILDDVVKKYGVDVVCVVFVDVGDIIVDFNFVEDVVDNIIF